MTVDAGENSPKPDVLPDLCHTEEPIDIGEPRQTFRNLLGVGPESFSKAFEGWKRAQANTTMSSQATDQLIRDIKASGRPR